MWKILLRSNEIIILENHSHFLVLVLFILEWIFVLFLKVYSSKLFLTVKIANEFTLKHFGIFY